MHRTSAHSPASPALPALHRPLSALAALALLAAVGGCAGNQSAEDRQLSSLRDEISRVQAESDRFEQRLDKLEVDSADVHTDGSPAEASAQPARSRAAPMATPPLRVVRIGADGTEETGDPGETAGSIGGSGEPRMRIQGTGSDATISTDGAKARRPDAPVAANTSTSSFTNANLGPTLAAHSASRPSALDEDAKHAYDAALALVHEKHYPDALEALAGFLVRWPDHPNADNAMYWRGECYFAQGEYTNAAQEFDGLLARFPMGNKAPDALLKLGLSQQHLGHADDARQRFDRLRREFPHSDAARHIPAGAETVRTGAPARSMSGANP